MKNSGLCQSKTVLLVDSLDHSRISIKWFLSSFGYIVDSVCAAEEAISIFDASVHDLVVTDYFMAGMNGVELAHIIKMRSPSTSVVMYSRIPPYDHSGIDVFIPKPENVMEHYGLSPLKESIDDLLLARVEHA